MTKWKLFIILILMISWRLEGFASNQPSTSERKYLTIIGTVDGNVHAIDQNFQKVWSTSLGDPMIKSNMSPTKIKKRYTNVIPSLDGSILFQNSQGIRRSPIKSRTAVDLSPSLSKDGLIHIGTKNCKLYCLNLADGSIIVDAQDREAQSLKRNGMDNTPIDYDKTIPFWLGRLDYKVEGMDAVSGEDEFSVTYSELEPLRNGNFLSQVDTNRALLDAKGSNNKAVSLSTQLPLLYLEETLMPEHTDIISSPEGYIQFVDNDGSLLNAEPLHLRSPAMHAFLLVLGNNNAAQLLKRLNVRYGLSNMNSLHKLKSNKPRLQLGSNSLSDNSNMVLIQSSSTDGGSEYLFGMDLVEVPHQPLLPSSNSDAMDIISNEVAILPNLDLMGQNNYFSHSKSAVKSPVQSMPKLGRNVKSFRKSEKFEPVLSNNISMIVDSSASVAINHSRKQVNSIIGFHKLSHSDEELWFEELFEGKTGKVRSRIDARTKMVDFKIANILVNENFLFIGMSILIIVLILIIIILLNPARFTWLNSSVLSSPNRSQISPAKSLQDNVSTPTSQKETSNTTRVGSLLLHHEIIGYGSHGTVVFKGYLHGRAVAVKRMLAQFNHLADREISVLIKSDGHPNVVRYFVKEERNDFVYLGLQLCECSLKDLIMAIKGEPDAAVLPKEIPDAVRTVLLQVAEGLSFLHTNRIVHRDIKPHNILCSRNDDNSPDTASSVYHTLARYTLKISDMGLSKQLDGENSFSTLSLPTSRHHPVGVEQKVFEPVGTIGWQAPEMITSKQESMSQKSDEPLMVDGVSRKTMAVDVFSLGCVFYFILSVGSHPFGEWFEREANIVNNRLSLEKLKHIPDAFSLIAKMLDVNPAKRPSSIELCNHHFFWTSSKRLDYLTSLSDKLEQTKSDSSMILMLQSKAADIFGIRWDRNIDETLLEDSGKYRKYDPYAVADLLRLIRNKRNHYHELGAATKEMFGSFPDGFCHYFEAKFPTLLGICIEIETTIALVDDSANSYSSAMDTRETNTNRETSEAVMACENSVSPIIGNCIVWQDSALCNTFQCRGWWRDATEWTDMLTYSSSSKASKKTRSVHHTRALSDAKYRTKLCSHWEMSNGESCPMRKKGKCVFAHGLLELRLRDIRVDAYRGTNNLDWNSPKN